MLRRSVGNLPASFSRRDMRGWLVASSFVGIAAGAVTLWVLWRPLPLLSAPIGTLGDHASFWAKLAAHQLFPFAFNDSSLFYLSHWHGLDAAGRLGIELRLGVSALAALVPFGLFAKPYLTAREQYLFVRGSRRHEGKAGARRLRARFGPLAARQPDHEVAPNVPWPSSMWARHVLLVGGVGSGKSTVLRPLVRKIIEANERLFLFDPKGEFTSAFEKPAIVAPWDRRSCAWDLAKDLRNVQDMRRFANATIKESHDPMWANAARQLLVGLLIHLRRTRGAGWNWRDLSELVSLPQPALLSIMETCHREAIRAVEKASVTTTGVLINLSAFCSPIHDLAEAWGDTPPERRISVVAWARGASEHRQLVLQGHSAYGDLTRCYVEGMAAVFATLINSVEFDDDLTRKIWFLADEFAQAGKLPVRSLFEVGRSRGVRCVVACQDFAQLQEVYGDKFVQALLSMCGTLIAGQIMPGETAESLCKVFGSREVERPNVSQAKRAGPDASTLSYSREEISLYKPSELASRLGPTDDGKGVRLIVFVGGETHEIVWPICPLPTVRPAHAPAAWTLGQDDSELGDAAPERQERPAGENNSNERRFDVARKTEEERIQHVLREAQGQDNPQAKAWLEHGRMRYWRERLALLPSALRKTILGARRACIHAISVVPALRLQQGKGSTRSALRPIAIARRAIEKIVARVSQPRVSSAASYFSTARDRCGAAETRTKSSRFPPDNRTEREKQDDDRANEQYWDDRREEGYEAARSYASRNAEPLRTGWLRARLSEWRRRVIARRK